MKVKCYIFRGQFLKEGFNEPGCPFTVYITKDFESLMRGIHEAPELQMVQNRPYQLQEVEVDLCDYDILQTFDHDPWNQLGRIKLVLQRKGIDWSSKSNNERRLDPDL